MTDAVDDGRLSPAPAHVHRVRIYWEDTDASGIVYHANYLKFTERARTEWLRALGRWQSRVLDESGIAFVVRRAEMEFHRPARLDDLLDVETRLGRVSGATLTVNQSIIAVEDSDSGDERAESDTDRCFRPTLVTVCVQLACVDQRGRAVRLPPAFRATASA
ncbi:YbgC/FadM family acyl-CoA thioesterase [Fodinicurvata sp. EGI_FJ10296]|uniref:YbgC/FadM family acyl-CoA thioesterase n=1 Tax=Fodinicurvata sp. EGI_FJ10296 TaxID=3231908 RepID=UPI003452AC36